MAVCPLCRAADTSPYHRDKRRGYVRCACCALVFVPAQYHLDPTAEKAEYDHHENSPDDPAYRAFLHRLFEPLNRLLPPGSHGLDFGCGPGPTLSVMLEEVGHRVTLFDPYYAPGASHLQATYAFITASEVVEHLKEPGRELDRLWSLLESGGLLALMTQCVRDLKAFSTWRYKDDPTHVGFFHEDTMRWLAAHWGAALSTPAHDVFLFRKNESGLVGQGQ